MNSRFFINLSYKSVLLIFHALFCSFIMNCNTSAKTIDKGKMVDESTSIDHETEQALESEKKIRSNNRKDTTKRYSVKIHGPDRTYTKGNGNSIQPGW